MIPDAWACNPNTMVRAAGTTCRRYDSTVTLSMAPAASRVETRPSPSVHGGRWWSGLQKCVCTSVIIRAPGGVIPLPATAGEACDLRRARLVGRRSVDHRYVAWLVSREYGYHTSW